MNLFRVEQWEGGKGALVTEHPDRAAALIGMLEQRDKLREKGWKVIDWGNEGTPYLLMEKNGRSLRGKRFLGGWLNLGLPQLKLTVTMGQGKPDPATASPGTMGKVWKYVEGRYGQRQRGKGLMVLADHEGYWYGAIFEVEGGKWGGWWVDNPHERGGLQKYHDAGYEWPDQPSVMEFINRQFRRGR